jgi:hypothetical protein
MNELTITSSLSLNPLHTCRALSVSISLANKLDELAYLFAQDMSRVLP